jgi:sterol desaturase/sphingolipid hydroxylase (fatty acid hydroxylase superfamily)
VNSLLYETKISTIDMKVLVYSNFSKNKTWKKMKSPSSMRNGRFHPSKCRSKVQKTREEVQKTREEILKGLFSNLLIHAAYLFGLMWSTLAGWLQHLPTLSILLVEFSFPHNL